MAAALKCPQCKEAIGLFDIASEFDCPKCNSALTSTGWGAVRVAEGLLFVFGGCVVAILWVGFGWIGGLLATAALIAAEVYARRALLRIEPTVEGLKSNVHEAT